jgi:ABC-2 type transport system permease protein
VLTVIWFKTWVESRQRFLVASTAVLLALAWAVLNCDQAMRRFDQVPPITFTQYVWYVYAGRFQLVWAALALFLGLGGLLRERALGTAQYTLSLPVTRSQWIAARAIIGLSEAAVLAAIPVVVIPIAARMVGRTYPALEALKLSGLLLCAGVVFFFLGVFYSSLLGGEFASMIAGLFSIYLIFTSQDYLYRWLPYFSMSSLLSGADVVDRATGFLTAFPWPGVLKSLVAAGILYVSAREITAHRDF